jgi:hypothetical protein
MHSVVSLQYDIASMASISSVGSTIPDFLVRVKGQYPIASVASRKLEFKMVSEVLKFELGAASALSWYDLTSNAEAKA